MTPEGKVKAAVKKALKEVGAYFHFPVQNGMGAPCLDCHGCYKGMYFAIETKRPGGVPTARQDETIRNIAASGGFVMVISEAKNAAVLIPNLLEEAYVRFTAGRHRHP